MEKVSLIIPVYNAGAYLARCLDSVVRQTYEHLETILIENGSQDNSWEICEKYAADHSGIIALRCTTPGVSNARNIGLAHASGRYIAFADADDWLEPMYISALVAALECSGADMSACGWTESNEVFSYPEGIIPSENALLHLMNAAGGHYLAVWGKLFRRRDDLAFDTTLAFLEDGVFLCGYLKEPGKAVFICDALYHYEINPDSVSRDFCPSSGRFTAFKALETMMELVKTSESLTKSVKSKYYVVAHYLLFYSYLGGHFNEITDYLPLLRKNWLCFYTDKNRRLKNKIRYMGYDMIVRLNLGVRTAEWWQSLLKRN